MELGLKHLKQENEHVVSLSIEQLTDTITLCNETMHALNMEAQIIELAETIDEHGITDSIVQLYGEELSLSGIDIATLSKDEVVIALYGVVDIKECETSEESLILMVAFFVATAAILHAMGISYKSISNDLNKISKSIDSNSKFDDKTKVAMSSYDNVHKRLTSAVEAFTEMSKVDVKDDGSVEDRIKALSDKMGKTSWATYLLGTSPAKQVKQTPTEAGWTPQKLKEDAEIIIKFNDKVFSPLYSNLKKMKKGTKSSSDAKGFARMKERNQLVQLFKKASLTFEHAATEIVRIARRSKLI